ncbi:hypothetical protein CCMA1212_003348 [Trichoderma ghanense]|uniref:Uncharacterized protein n=1 Tax=Trichoderma ghanense TaxID=65468 RepID=A0ABY2H8I2_9HYPO
MPRCPRMRCIAQQFVPLGLAEPMHSTAPCPDQQRPVERSPAHLSAPVVGSTGRRFAALRSSTLPAGAPTLRLTTDSQPASAARKGQENPQPPEPRAGCPSTKTRSTSDPAVLIGPGRR